MYNSMRSAPVINSAIEKVEVIPQINTYAVVGKETGHKGGQR